MGLSRFVIVDLGGPSVPQELYATVPHFKIPFVAILEKGRTPHSMFVDLLENDHVLEPLVRFRDTEELMSRLEEPVIAPAEARLVRRLESLTELLG